MAKPAHFNQNMMFYVEDASIEQIREALKALAKHHDILRGVYRNEKLFIRPFSGENYLIWWNVNANMATEHAKRLRKYVSHSRKAWIGKWSL